MTYSDTGYSIMGIHERSAAVRAIEMVQEVIFDSIPFDFEDFQAAQVQKQHQYYLDMMQEFTETKLIMWTTLENARLLLTGEASE